jgi:hypothetical protein
MHVRTAAQPVSPRRFLPHDDRSGRFDRANQRQRASSTDRLPPTPSFLMILRVETHRLRARAVAEYTEQKATGARPRRDRRACMHAFVWYHIIAFASPSPDLRRACLPRALPCLRRLGGFSASPHAVRARRAHSTRLVNNPCCQLPGRLRTSSLAAEC